MDPAIREALAAGRLEQAEAAARASLARDGSQMELWKVLGAILRAQGRFAETLEIQDTLVEVRPADLPGRFDLAETLLLLGDFDRGWREYRHRYSLAHTRPIERKVQGPRWAGEPLAGKTLLIHDEQGYGDIFQFIRLVPWVKARTGARVVLEIHPDLEGFARRLGGADEIVPRGGLLPPFDVYCELMSLPMAMGLRLEDLPGPMPYLSALPARVAKWRKILAGVRRPLVALVWAGSPTHTNDANRSIRLAGLAPLAMTGAGFVSIQKGPAAAEALTPPPGLSIRSLGPQIRDFEDTAAILQLADLLISIDSSPVHLAGALGRPAWVLLPLVPDWRWLTERGDTPWYPSLRLFRQTARGDWADVVARVTGALGGIAG